VAFDYLADFSKHPEWSQGLLSMTRTSVGEPGPGTTYCTEESAAGSKDITVSEITELQRPRRIAWKAQTEKQSWPTGARSIWSFDIEQEGAGSRVTQRMELIPASRAMVRALFFVADTFFGGTGATPKSVRKNAERLEQRLASMKS
jgi:hypothetical protein